MYYIEEERNVEVASWRHLINHSDILSRILNDPSFDIVNSSVRRGEQPHDIFAQEFETSNQEQIENRALMFSVIHQGERGVNVDVLWDNSGGRTQA